MTRARGRGSRLARLSRLTRVVPFVVPTALLAWITIARVLARVGHAAATLDDAWIHFQYARAIAEGHPLRFFAGEPLSSGATSLLWPAALAPFWLVGFRGASIVWGAWLLSYVALGALAFEIFHLTRKLTGRQTAMGAAAMVFASSALAWCAASGMEVVPFAWMIARTLRRASEWSEAEAPLRSARARRELTVLAFALPLLRPEGAIFSLFAGATLAFFPAAPTRRERVKALPALLAPAILPLLLWIATGAARSSTMEVKLLAGNPYYPTSVLVAHVAANVRLMVGTLLNGEVWSLEFLPAHGAPLWMAGLVAIAAEGARRRVKWRAAGALLFALTMFVPCTYDTFLWNRLRYLWPFFPGWLIGAACAAELAGDMLASVQARWKLVTPLLCGIVVGALAMRLDGALDDVADSASGIDRQQAALGRWAKETLPVDARIGVNDTGAIAYFGERRTFDVVGLTTPEEARYWVAGAGSRLEHYETLAKTQPGRLPTHFIVYPEWMACDAVLGEPLTQAEVLDATILGGTIMRAFVADYSRLGSGERPWTAYGDPIDVLDVADLDSEADHGYRLLGAATGEQIARMGEGPAGTNVVDGGRTRRTRERFALKIPANARTLAARVEAEMPTRMFVSVENTRIGQIDVLGPGWSEVAIGIPEGTIPEPRRERAEIEITSDAPLTTYHYWVF